MATAQARAMFKRPDSPSAASILLPLAGIGISRIGLIGLLLAAMAALIYLSGGTQFATVHLLYLPVLLAAACYGPAGGLACGLLAGLLAGPFMPHNVEAALSQSALNWLLRMAALATVGAVAGILFARFARLNTAIAARALIASGTGLSNALGLEQTLRQPLEATSQPGTLLLVRVNNLEDILSSLGMEEADGLIRHLAGRLSKACADAPVFDLGQRTLALLLPLGGRPLATTVERVAAINHAPMDAHDLSVYVDISLGSAPVSAGISAPLLVRQARCAARSAARVGALHQAYDPTEELGRRRRVDLLAELAGALRRNELVVYYQPKINLRSGRVVGVEALVRWQHPTRGLVPPGDFVPPAEHTALIHPLTRYVIGRALQDAAGWRAVGIPLQIAINLSARNLQDPELVPFIAERAEKLGLAPDCLEFEITETAIIHESTQFMAAIAAIKAMGSHVSIDDFGTGYTSLAFLTRLPIDRIKIDQLFIRGMREDVKLRQIVSSVTGMAQQLGMDVVAEGIEDAETAELVTQMGVDVGQGYHYAAPMPARTVLDWIHHSPWQAP